MDKIDLLRCSCRSMITMWSGSLMQAATHERGLGWRDEYIDRVEAT